MYKFGMYLGGQRAFSALASARSRAIDIPLAGYLDSGRHLVVLELVEPAKDYVHLTFVACNGTGIHNQAVAWRDSLHLTALAQVVEFDSTATPVSGGAAVWITLDYPENCYRVLRGADGYRARAGASVYGPFGRLRELESEMAKLGVKPGRLEITEYDKAGA